MFELPNIVKEINKEKKSTKITTLDKATALVLKRFFSGCFSIDYAIGGGYAYKRIQLLYGGKSAGKNAFLNQMIAYNQRICRHCFRILPEFYEAKEVDRWTALLLLMGINECTCDKSIGKRIVILDYEKSYALEDSKIIRVKKLTYKDSGEELDELDYNDLCDELEGLRVNIKTNEKKKARFAELEAFLNNINIEETEVKQDATTDYLVKCGVVANRLLIADPEDTEEGIDYARKIIRSGEVDAIIWDSLQAAVPKHVLGRDADQDTMGVEAKKNSLLMRQVCSAFAAVDLEDEKEAYKAPIFLVSQVRATVGSFVPVPDKYSGGRAVEHHISLALELKREHFLREDGTKAEFGGDFYGQKVRLRIEKSKLNAPSGMFECDYYFKQGSKFSVGIDHIGELVNLGVRFGILERTGAWYKTPDGEKVQGINELYDFFRSKPEALGRLYQHLHGHI